MASSSDWIAAFQEQTRSAGEASPPNAGQSWIESLQTSSGFVEGLPVMPREPTIVNAPVEETPPPETRPKPEAIDPLAEAFAKGEASGKAMAQAQYAAEQEQQRKLRLNFRTLDSAAMDSLASELSDTVIALCSAAIADFRPDPEALLERCRKAAERFTSAAEGCALHLNPNDAAQLDDQLPDHWRITPDETIERGGLRFEGPDAAISDGPAEWRKAISAAIRGL